jgi:hypothetical protein
VSVRAKRCFRSPRVRLQLAVVLDAASMRRASRNNSAGARCSTCRTRMSSAIVSTFTGHEDPQVQPRSGMSSA